MAERAAEPMGGEAFLEWAEGREGRWELVDGVVVGMAGAKRRHDQLVVNALALLRTQLRGTGCRAFTGDTAVQTGPRTIRRPDLGVDCGQADPDALAAADARLVVEVLSPSTRQIDVMRKLDEYRALPGLDHVLIVNPEIVQALLWSRSDGTWSSLVFEALEQQIDIVSLGVSLPLAALYEDVPLAALYEDVPLLPRLVN